MIQADSKWGSCISFELNSSTYDNDQDRKVKAKASNKEDNTGHKLTSFNFYNYPSA